MLSDASNQFTTLILPLLHIDGSLIYLLPFFKLIISVLIVFDFNPFQLAIKYMQVHCVMCLMSYAHFCHVLVVFPAWVGDIST